MIPKPKVLLSKFVCLLILNY
ncbi:hypothetical protein MTBSS4_660006 [Magnetospirillum sp. SS-4]|nr:hypothetical protein MTBSS4_660006 [Magnetospirillum sp. SS-4]